MLIRSEALPYVFPPAAVCAAATAAGYVGIATGAGIVALLLAAFFRDPQRFSDAAANAILAPADGKVVDVDEHSRMIVIFLSIFNVHITRAPFAGKLCSWERVEGGYAFAFRESASHNARCVLSMETTVGPLELSLMGGAVARRIVQWVQPGRDLERGERVALIKFGSRAELRLPRGCVAMVSVGDRVRAGETIVAEARPTKEGS